MADTGEDIRRSLKEVGQEIAKLLEQAGGMVREAAGDVGRWAGKTVGHEGGESPLDQIERLGELRDRGFVTDEEFQAKKAELLTKLT
jgi:hypothetical protein